MTEDGDGIPALRIDSGIAMDEFHALNIHVVARTTVDTVVQEAVNELTQAVVGATQWLTEAVRGELICQAMAAVDAIEEAETYQESFSLAGMVPEVVESLPLFTRPPSAVIHAVAKTAIDAATDEAVKEIIQAVQNATEWITHAVRNEIISEVIDPEEGLAVHNVTKWITQAVHTELVAHAVTDAIPVDDASTVPEEQEEFGNTAEVAEFPRISLQIEPYSVDDARELAKSTTEAAVHIALQNIARAIGDTSDWFPPAVRGEILALAVDEAALEVLPANEAANNSIDTEEPHERLPDEAVHDVVHLPVLPLESSLGWKAKGYNEFVVSFVEEVVSSALHQDPSTEPEDDAYDDDYTPINSPTAEAASSKPPSARASEQDCQFKPPVFVSGRATPPDSKPTTRRSPIIGKRGLGTPTSTENSSALEPLAVPVDEAPVSFSEPEPLHSALPPLVLPGIHGPQISSRTKHHQHKTPRKTPRQASYPPYREDSPLNDSPRAASTSSSRLNKHTSRACISAEFDLTPLSSARAAALIYAQQPSSSRHHHHHHKSKKLRDAASQTSPPPSPPPSVLPRECLQEVHVDSYGTELPKTQTSPVKNSPRELSSPELGAEKKSNGSSNTLLAPLSKTPMSPDTSKLQRPSRTHKNHGHGHKGGSGGSSPNKRSGFCQRCVFEGRSCKVNDCLKHQVLK